MYCNGFSVGSGLGLGCSFGRHASQLVLVLGLPGRAPVMSAIRDTIHWLTFPQRVTFKLCLTTYKCLHGLAPPYLTQILYITYRRRRPHSSADQHKLFVPRTSTSTLGPRAFCSSGPSLWNALPQQLQTIPQNLSA